MLKTLLETLITPAYAQSLDSVYTPAGNLPKAGDSGILATFLGPIVSLLPIAAGIASFIIALFAGFRYVASSGNQKETQAAANMLTFSLVGLGLSILAFWITRIVFTVAGGQGLF